MGVNADPNTAEYWLKTAAGRGEQEAQNQLGLLYLQPEFLASRPQAMRWFMRAAAGGSARAEHNLGLIYTLGMGVQADREQAIHWFRRAAQHGLGASKANLGVLLVNSPKPADQAEGFGIVLRTADDENPDIENALGYWFGAGTKVDLPKAVDWYKRAAAKGNALAMYNLATMYRTGTGVKQDFKQAFRLHLEACDSGDQKACVAVSNAYLNGEGTGRNYIAAYRFALMAGADAKTIAVLEQPLAEADRNRAAEEAEQWKQVHAVQLSAAPH
jgi:TPR repeat protein